MPDGLDEHRQKQEKALDCLVDQAGTVPQDEYDSFRHRE
jgi:hypothetical protein